MLLWIIEEPIDPRSKAAKLEAIESNAKAAAPFFIHESPAEKNVSALDFQTNIAQFRGPAGATRIEVSFLTPLLGNTHSNISTESKDTLEIIYSSLIRDLTYETIIRVGNSRKLPVKYAALENLPNAVNTMTMIAPPRMGEIFLQIKDTFDERLGYAKQYIDVRDFRGRTLMLSDIQLYTEVTNENQRRALPVMKKEDISVAPYPYESIRKEQPFFCYFEIYNLLTGGVANTYEIDIRIEWDRNR
ncbi:unnamed protein product, partial [marine sediment metagenome]